MLTRYSNLRRRLSLPTIRRLLFLLTWKEPSSEISADLIQDHRRLHSSSTSTHLSIDASIHLHICAREPRPESTLRYSTNPGRIPPLGNADVDIDHGRISGSPSARHRCPSSTSLRLLDTSVSHIPRRQELHPDTSCNQAAFWRRADYNYNQGLRYGHTTWTSRAAAASEHWVGEWPEWQLGRQRAREKVRRWMI
jgi:hypothetical protein